MGKELFLNTLEALLKKEEKGSEAASYCIRRNKMQKLLKKQERLTLDLLALLYLYNGEPLTINWCMDVLGDVDRRAVITIIENLSKKNLNFHIMYSKKNIKATFLNEFSLDDMYHEYYKNSVEVVLLDRVFDGGVKNLVEYSENHFYSYSTLYRKIQKLNTYYLSDFKLTIGKKKCIAGKEYSIRCYYASLYNVIYGHRKMKFQEEMIKSEKYLKSIQLGTQYLYSKLTLSEQKNVLYYFTISRLRMVKNPIKLRTKILKNNMFEGILDDFGRFTAELELPMQQKKIERNWILFYFIIIMKLKKTDIIEKYATEKIFEELYKYDITPENWLNDFSQFVSYSLKKSEHSVMKFRLYQKIYQQLYFSKVVESLDHNPEKNEPSGRMKSIIYQVEFWYDRYPYKKTLVCHGITIELIAILLLEHTDFLKINKKIYIGTKKGWSWDQHLAKQLLTIELAEQITVVEKWGETTDFVIVDQKIPVLPECKTFIISKNPSKKEVENIQKELQRLLT